MVLHKKEREMIYNVHSFMKKEADMGSVSNIKQAMKRTAEATKSSVATVRRIVKAVRDCKSEFPAFDTPGKNKRNKKKPKTDIDNVNKGIVRRAIHTFHVLENELPTLSRLRKKFQNEINFQGSEASLGRVIKDLGFKWLKIENTNRRLLLEKSQIRLKRIEYLQLIKKYRDEGRTIVFTDESYIDSSHVVPQNNSTKDVEPEEGSKSTKDVPKPPPRVRLIIVHAGDETGLVPNALLTFEVSTKPGDTDHITFDIYQRWLQNKLIPNLPPNSVVVIKNAPYHNKKLEPAPLSTAKTTDMKRWLTQKGIPFDQTMLKPELYDVIKAHRDQFKQLTIDNILGEKGHLILRLPPHHEDLNPFEMSWLEIRRHVAMNIDTWNINRVTDLVNEKMGLIEVVEWANFSKEVTEIEQIYRDNEQVIDTLSESFVISGYDDDNNTDTEDECSSDDDFSDEEPPPKVNTASISGLQLPTLTGGGVNTDKLDPASKNSFLYVNVEPQPQPLMHSAWMKNKQNPDKKEINEDKQSPPHGEWNPIKVEPADPETELIVEPEIYYPENDSDSEDNSNKKKRKINNGDNDPRSPNKSKEDSINVDARKMFLLSLLPGVKLMTDREMKVFRKTTVACIESIFDARKKY